MRKYNLFLTVAATLALAGCASVAGGPRMSDTTSSELERREDTPQGNRAGNGGTDHTRVDMLPFLDLTTDTSRRTGPPLSDSYTRLIAEGAFQNSHEGSDAIAVRDYDAEDRPWWARWLLGRSVSRVLTVKATVDRPQLDVTVPLASASHQSNSTAGERWETEMNGRRNLSPFFRVDASTSMSIAASVNATSSTQNNVTGAVLGIVQQAASLVAPKSKLLTTLNSDRIKQASDFVDQSISALFGQTIIERSVNDFRLDGFSSNPYVTIQARFPMQRDITSGDLYLIGEWKIFLEEPIISIFSTELRCDPEDAEFDCESDEHAQARAEAAFDGLTPHTVLGLDVGENLDLEASIRAQSNIAATLTAANGADQAETRDAATRTLCSQVAAHAEGLGLNRFDTAAVVWAVSQSELVTAEAATSLMAQERCTAARLAREVGLLVE